MLKNFNEIPLMRELIAYLRSLANNPPEIIQKLKDLDDTIAQDKTRHKAILEAKGILCFVCGRKFLPSPDGSDNGCCSIGCRSGDCL